MLVAFWRWWKLLQHLSTEDIERNLCQDLLTIENTADSDLKVHALHYANELYASDFPFKNFCKLAKQTETIRNYQKQGLVMIKHCLGKSQINSIPEYRVFLRNFCLQNKRKILLVQLARADIIHSEREIEVLFSILKNSPFPSAPSIELHIRTLVLIPCLIPCHRCEKSTRESRHSHRLIGQRDNIRARDPDMCVDPRGYMTSGWRNLF